jgi:hypothetical protein
MSEPLALNSPYIQRMVSYLQNHSKLSGNLNLPQAQYKSTEIMEVPIVPAQGAEPLQCWFNANEQEKTGNGKTIFGWALWDGPYDTTCAAQHHAILLLPGTAGYIDVTPADVGTQIGHITFFADARVPFDYANTRQPPLLLMNKSGKNDYGIEFVWTNEKFEALKCEGAWEIYEDNFMMVRMGSTLSISNK